MIDNVGVETPESMLWNVGEVATVSWNPASLVLSEHVISATSVRVDISVWTFNNVTAVLSVTLATNLPNSGSASILLPDSIVSDLPPSDYNLTVSIVKVSVNTSTTNLSLSTRITPEQLRGISRFGKVLTLSHATPDFTARRLLCEAWKVSSPPFPLQNLPPCPCNEEGARVDDRFEEETPLDGRSQNHFYSHNRNNYCYSQANVR